MYINPNRAVYTNIYVPDLNHDDNNFKYLYPPPPPTKKERHWVSSFIVPMQYPV